MEPHLNSGLDLGKIDEMLEAGGFCLRVGFHCLRLPIDKTDDENAAPVAWLNLVAGVEQSNYDCLNLAPDLLKPSWSVELWKASDANLTEALVFYSRRAQAMHLKGALMRSAQSAAFNSDLYCNKKRQLQTCSSSSKLHYYPNYYYIWLLLSCYSNHMYLNKDFS